MSFTYVVFGGYGGICTGMCVAYFDANVAI